MKNEVYITKNSRETEELGEDFIKGSDLVQGRTLKRPLVMVLYGDLGSGKTTFVQGLAKGLGITRRILSPTFIILRHYEIPKSSATFYHIDLYRTNSKKDLEGLGIGDLFNDSKNIIAIEWGEKMGELMPKDRIDIRFKYLGEEKRKIIIDDC